MAFTTVCLTGLGAISCSQVGSDVGLQLRTVIAPSPRMNSQWLSSGKEWDPVILPLL